MPEVRPASPTPDPMMTSGKNTGMDASRSPSKRMPVAPAELPRYGIHVYGGPRCSLAQAVLAELQAAGLSATFHDVVHDARQKELARRYREYFYNGYLLLLVVDGQPRRIEFGSIAAAAGGN